MIVFLKPYKIYCYFGFCKLRTNTCAYTLTLRILRTVFSFLYVQRIFFLLHLDGADLNWINFSSFVSNFTIWKDSIRFEENPPGREDNVGITSFKLHTAVTDFVEPISIIKKIAFGVIEFTSISEVNLYVRLLTESKIYVKMYLFARLAQCERVFLWRIAYVQYFFRLE